MTSWEMDNSLTISNLRIYLKFQHQNVLDAVWWSMSHNISSFLSACAMNSPRYSSFASLSWYANPHLLLFCIVVRSSSPVPHKCLFFSCLLSHWLHCRKIPRMPPWSTPLWRPSYVSSTGFLWGTSLKPNWSAHWCIRCVHRCTLCHITHELEL